MRNSTCVTLIVHGVTSLCAAFQQTGTVAETRQQSLVVHQCQHSRRNRKLSEHTHKHIVKQSTDTEVTSHNTQIHYYIILMPEMVTD